MIFSYSSSILSLSWDYSSCVFSFLFSDKNNSIEKHLWYKSSVWFGIIELERDEEGEDGGERIIAIETKNILQCKKRTRIIIICYIIAYTFSK
jgi:hypothetical protein